MNVKFIFRYWLIWIFILAAIAFGLNIHRVNSFDNNKLEKFIGSPSRFRQTSQDVCLRQVSGDPVEPNNDSVKIHFFCRGGVKAENTLSLSVLPNKTIHFALKEVARINAFEESLLDGWKCNLEKEEISDKSQEFSSGDLIECYE